MIYNSLLFSIFLVLFSCTDEVKKEIMGPAVSVEIIYPQNNSSLNEPITIETWVADEEDIVNIKFFINGINEYTDMSPPYKYLWNVCNGNFGENTIHLKAIDNAGNEGFSDFHTVTVNVINDCDNICGGTSWESDCGCVTADNSGDECDDCAGIPEGSAVINECEICVGGTTGLGINYLKDCAGTCSGDAKEDNCGTCDADISNDCIQDCAGNWGGDAEIDECGLCGGGNTDGICVECGDGYVFLWGVCYNIIETTELNLSNHGLSGSIPSDIEQLTNLTNLQLGSNQLVGKIPEEICNLPNISNSTIFVQNNQLCPPYPNCISQEDIDSQDTSNCE